MTATKNKKNRLKLPKITLPSFEGLSSAKVSYNVFYGTFLSVGFLVAGLLYGSSYQVASVRVIEPTMTLGQARLQTSGGKFINGSPMEEMTPYIIQQNKTTASFLVGIAKKESNWGKRVPRLPNGDDCFNYWGYRGEGTRGTAMGHGCFGSREEAVQVVSARLNTFVDEYHFDTAEELIVWKCGWSCDGHSGKSVKKWIADVGYYSRQVH